ncbi:MAG: alpha/beta hydrolase [Anaerolineales bacterium]|nr:alpha/beta hydrolase [Anaerolineales bacterium]
MPTVGGLYYYASKNGNGQPVLVLLHGAGGNHLHWPYNLRRLNNYKVYAPDLPGHGKSRGLGEQSVQKYAAAVAEWMQAVGIKKAVIGGHSMGGAIAQTIALEYPNLVSGLILVATAAKLSVSQDILFKLSTPNSTPSAIELILKWSWMPGTDAKLLEKVHDQMMGIRSAVIYGDYLACSNFDLTGRVNKIKVPTLVIAGERDEMIPLDILWQLESGIKSARIAVIPNAGHMVMLEQPDQVAREAQSFLADIS